ncbi:MAG: hypothetical protein U0905_06710 [Pirellulales bacterium]
MEFEANPNHNNMSATTSYAPEASAKPTKAMMTAMGEKLAAELEVFDKVACEVKSKLNASLPAAERRRQVVASAAELFGVAPTWVAFFREVFAREGIISTLFSQSDRKDYELSDEHGEVLEMLTTLRSRELPENDPSESQRMITVRIPKCVHDYICDEANALDVSVNKLCISRLLQRSDERMIPTSQQKRRGRKPGSPTPSASLSVVTNHGMNNPS